MPQVHWHCSAWPGIYGQACGQQAPLTGLAIGRAGKANATTRMMQSGSTLAHFDSHILTQVDSGLQQEQRHRAVPNLMESKSCAMVARLPT